MHYSTLDHRLANTKKVEFENLLDTLRKQKEEVGINFQTDITYPWLFNKIFQI